MFELIFKAIAELTPNFQIIITDHADLGADPDFQSAIAEKCAGELVNSKLGILPFRELIRRLQPFFEACGWVSGSLGPSARRSSASRA